MKKTSAIRAASVQFNHKPGDKKYNLSRIEYYSRLAAEQKAHMVIFPEMCISGYWHVRNLDRNAIEMLAESIPDGPSAHQLSLWAQEFNLIIGAGLIERSESGRLYNSYLVCQPNGKVHTHRKLHCFINESMSSGEEYTVIDTELGVRLGVLICWDNNLIENARMTALKGADILLAPHQTGGCDSRSPQAMGLIDPKLWYERDKNPEAIEAECQGPKGREWLMRWLPSRAHDNGMFIVFSNGVGVDDDEVRTGNAMLIDPYGRILSESTSVEDDIVIDDLDLSLLDRCTGRRWIRGRRPELYSALCEVEGNEFDAREARFSNEKTS